MPEEEEEVPRHQIFCTSKLTVPSRFRDDRFAALWTGRRAERIRRSGSSIYRYTGHSTSSSSDCARPRNTHGEPPTTQRLLRAPVQQLLRKHASRRNSLTQSLQPMPARVARPQRSIPQSSKRSISHSTGYRTRKPQHGPREPRSSMDSDASYHSTLDGRRCSWYDRML